MIADVKSKKILYSNLYTNSEINEGEHKRFKRMYGFDQTFPKSLFGCNLSKGCSVISLHNRYEGRIRNGNEKEARRIKHLARDYYTLEQAFRKGLSQTSCLVINGL